MTTFAEISSRFEQETTKAKYLYNYYHLRSQLLLRLSYASSEPFSKLEAYLKLSYEERCFLSLMQLYNEDFILSCLFNWLKSCGYKTIANTLFPIRGTEDDTADDLQAEGYFVWKKSDAVELIILLELFGLKEISSFDASNYSLTEIDVDSILNRFK